MKKLLLALVLGISTLSFAAFASQVNVNTANAKTLAKALDGVGAVKAQAIVDYRKTHGRFESLAELKKVKGIGNKTISENKDDIVFSDNNK